VASDPLADRHAAAALFAPASVAAAPVATSLAGAPSMANDLLLVLLLPGLLLLWLLLL